MIVFCMHHGFKTYSFNGLYEVNKNGRQAIGVVNFVSFFFNNQVIIKCVATPIHMVSY